ncbi:MAG TPA: glutathione S-transferase family protein [Aestuariivirgaceae bacterium]|nr:glutathione S-transferase family protein [Aestuariivirgaceae bacterium]
MITLWGRRNSMNVQKVIWALEELGLAYERRNVAGSYGGTDTPEFKAMNPMGLVPVIQDGDVTMFESNAIVRYLAARHGEGGLRPPVPKELAAAEQWMDWSQLNPGPQVMTLFLQSVRTPLEKQNRDAMENSVAQLHKLLPVADRALSNSAYLAGDHPTFGDIPLGVMIWRLSCFDWQRPALSHLDRWHEQLQTRSAYRKAVMLPTGKTPEEWLAYEKQFA